MSKESYCTGYTLNVWKTFHEMGKVQSLVELIDGLRIFGRHLRTMSKDKQRVPTEYVEVF